MQTDLQTGTLTTSDGVKLFTAHQLPDGEPKALVLVVHGYGEHCRRYRHVIDALTARGYAAFTLDHYGHGQSEGLRAYFDNFDRPLVDLKAYVDSFKPQYPDKPLFVLGHSMGALISLAFTLRHQDEISGLIISGAPVNADANVSPLMVALGYALNRIVPKMPLLNLGDSSILSSDPDVGKAFDADPLTYKGNMRVRLGISINETAKAVRERLPELKLPLLIMHGEADRMVNPSGSKLAYELASSADKTLRIYPNMYHEIMNERRRDIVLADILNWLDLHTA